MTAAAVEPVAPRGRPILFSAPMIRALLAGRKTQTRRLLTPQPIQSIMEEGPWKAFTGLVDVGMMPPSGEDERRIGWTWRGTRIMPWPRALRNQSPYGYPGDRLYVRETWAVGRGYDGLSPSDLPPGGSAKIKLHHLADGPKPDWAGKTRVSIHMPRWASRLTLEVASIRAEQLQEITEEDALAEGLSLITKDGGRTVKHGIPDRDGFPGTDNDGWEWQEWEVDPRKAFAKLWDRINGERAPWSSNPFVWVISFRRIDAR